MRSLNPVPNQSGSSLLHSIFHTLSKSLLFLCFSSGVVVLGALFGQHYLASRKHPNAGEEDLIRSFAAWDGEHYIEIAQAGYSYNPKKKSNVVFFPAYPLAGRFIATITGWRMSLCLLIVSYTFLIGAFAAATAYVDLGKSRQIPLREGEEFNLKENTATSLVLLIFGFFPTTFYFRMIYSESLFVFVVILTLYGMKQRWSLWALAAVVGLATATRPTGAALLVPFLCHFWERTANWKSFLVHSMFIIPAACWGLIGYIFFLYITFNDPLAFAKSHKHWDQRPAVPIAEKLWLELTIEPIYCVYDPSCKCYQRNGGGDPSPLFSMYFANPVYFMLFAALVILGGFKGWLSKEEVLAGAALLLFSYLNKGYAVCMCGQARYASVVFPVYLVLGQLLQRLPGPIVAMIIGVCGLFLGIYSALFVRWYYFI